MMNPELKKSIDVWKEILAQASEGIQTPEQKHIHESFSKQLEATEVKLKDKQS